jgi:hypothetical protein
MARDFGDFQTPPALVEAVLTRLRPLGPFARALEPTCGRGSFIAGLLREPVPPREIVGIELQAAHVAAARALAEDLAAKAHGDVSTPERPCVTVMEDDVFGVDLAALPWRADGPLLVVGNPPWVTNAELGALGSANRPERRRMHGLSGLAALTGASNFDLAEAVWLKLLRELGLQRPVVALLCKASVAHRVLRQADASGLGLSDARIYELSGPRWFGAQVAACLFVARAGGAPGACAEVHASLEETVPRARVGIVGGELIADLDAWSEVEALDGTWPLEWRQGVKHDATGVMELSWRGAGWVNGLGEQVDVEPDAVFPLMKATDLARGHWPPRRAVVVTQRTLGEPTERLAERLPRLWGYLVRHAVKLDGRRSSIYRDRPRFSMFGVGDYTFAPYKVAVSGLHSPPRFRVLGPWGGRPVLVDDTCYLLECSGAAEAAVLAAALGSGSASRFFGTLLFRGGKRPVTKRLLRRLALGPLLERVDDARLLHDAREQLRGVGDPLSEAEADVGEDALAGELARLRQGGGEGS